ncbi:hypothetical protein [Nonomuraea sp. NPDC005650]|uniref:hypothetical protein n=1 Tax=Nonomuraea sp. NPDC005650 TaxID=3157045 RepID=UPI0033BF43F6
MTASDAAAIMAIATPTGTYCAIRPASVAPIACIAFMPRGRGRVTRMVYEVATFQALCDRLRCKEIWVAGAGRWRNPDEDLPADFEARRAEHYAELRKPRDPESFCQALRQEVSDALAELDHDRPDLLGLR